MVLVDKDKQTASVLHKNSRMRITCANNDNIDEIELEKTIAGGRAEKTTERDDEGNGTSADMPAIMITNRSFLFSPNIPAKNNRDPAKDLRIPVYDHNDFLV